MKKKGLIISTVVMVVVLIAALTTTTFAWFSASTSATVDAVTLGAESASSLSIGVVKTPLTDPTNLESKPNIEGVLTGDVNWASTAWSGASGISSKITFGGLDKLATSSKAVSIASEQITEAGQEGSLTINADEFFKAEGTGIDAKGYEKKSIEKAVANADYFAATFVVQAVKDVEQIYLKLQVKGASADTVGIAAALHFAFYVNGKLIDVTSGTALAEGKISATNAHVSAFDKYTPTDNWGYNIAETEFTQSTDANRLGEADKNETEAAIWTYYLPIENSKVTGKTTYDSTVAKFIHVIAWIEGADESCINETTGMSGEITFEFVGELDSASKKTFEKGRIKAD